MGARPGYVQHGKDVDIIEFMNVFKVVSALVPYRTDALACCVDNVGSMRIMVFIV